MVCVVATPSLKIPLKIHDDILRGRPNYRSNRHVEKKTRHQHKASRQDRNTQWGRFPDRHDRLRVFRDRNLLPAIRKCEGYVLRSVQTIVDENSLYRADQPILFLQSEIRHDRCTVRSRCREIENKRNGPRTYPSRQHMRISRRTGPEPDRIGPRQTRIA